MANQQKREEYNRNENALKDSEKRARYFKAEYETMYYALEAEKLRPSYADLLKEKYPDVFKEATTPVENLDTFTEKQLEEEKSKDADTKE